jgi:hypothetical protein
MKQVLITALVVALGGCALAQTLPPPDTRTAQPQQPAATQAPATAPAASAAPTQNAPHIAPGSLIPARLTKTVDAKKVKQGDEVVAVVPGDLKATNGEVLVPKDTKIIGHVTESQARSKEQKESQLGIAFDQMTMKNGDQVQLPLSVQAIVAPPSRNPSAGGQEPSAGAPSPSAGNTPSGGGHGGMGGNNSQSQAPPSEGVPTNTQAPANPNPPITENTKGVVGIKDLTLSPTQDAAMGAIVTSEKNNVKLEDGTMLLLRVTSANQPSPSNSTPPSPQQ